MTANATLCPLPACPRPAPHHTAPAPSTKRARFLGRRRVSPMFWTRTKDVFTMSGEHIAGTLRLSGRKPRRGFLFWRPLERGARGRIRRSKRDTRGRKERRKNDDDAGESFETSFSSRAFFFWWRENGGQCIAGGGGEVGRWGQCCQWLSSEVPFGAFHHSPPSQKITCVWLRLRAPH